MFFFLIPLKSQSASHSWKSTCKHLEHTLISIQAQTSEHFEIIIVGTDVPVLHETHPKVTFLSADLPALTLQSRREDKETDKAKKLEHGINHILKKEITGYVMIVDADDFISRNIVKFIETQSESNGWLIDSGYIHQFGSSLLYRRSSSFCKWCGTSFIVSISVLRQVDIFKRSLNQLIFPHRDLDEKLANLGKPLQKLPFFAVCYEIGHGQNIYQSSWDKIHASNLGNTFFLMKELLKFRLINRSFYKEFSVPTKSFPISKYKAVKTWLGMLKQVFLKGRFSA